MDEKRRMEIQFIAPKSAPMCPDCGLPIDSHDHGCLSKYRAWYEQAVELKAKMPELFESKAPTATEISLKHRDAMERLRRGRE